MRSVYVTSFFICVFLLMPRVHGLDETDDQPKSGGQTESGADDNPLSGILGGILGEVMDRAKPESETAPAVSVKLNGVPERRSNAVTIEVAYAGAVEPDTRLTAVATSGGRPLQDIDSTTATLAEPSGVARLELTRAGENTAEVQSDGVDIIVLGAGEPAEELGRHSFSLDKTWSALGWAGESGARELVFSDGAIVDRFVEPSKPGAGAPGAKPVVLADKVYTAATAPMVVQNSQTIGTYRYTATTRAQVKKSGNVTAFNLTWKCENRACTISGPWPTPGVSACAGLARQVGVIMRYGHPKKQLNAAQLSRCNQGVNN